MRETRKQRAEREKARAPNFGLKPVVCASDFSDQSFPRVELALPLLLPPHSTHSLDLQPSREQQRSRSSKSQHEPTRAPRNRSASNFFSNQTRSSSSLFTALFDFPPSVCSDLIHTRFTLHYTSFTRPSPLSFPPLFQSQVDALFGQTFLF